jgi:hypothetical protein
MRGLTIDRERLSAVDLYHFIDWVRDDWHDDEVAVTRRLVRLRRHLELLPDPYGMSALAALATVERARVVNGEPWRAALVQIASEVAAWDRSRPPLTVCGVGGCQIAYLEPARLHEHRQLLHDCA